MNIKKVNMQKAVGIINLIVAILMTIGGLVIVLFSKMIVDILMEALEQAQGADTAALASMMGTFLLVMGIIIIPISIVMIVFSAKLIKAPNKKADGSFAERNGIVIFFLILNIIFIIGNISNFFVEGMFNFTTILYMAVYIASIVLSIMALKEKHFNTESENRFSQGSNQYLGNAYGAPHNADNMPSTSDPFEQNDRDNN